MNLRIRTVELQTMTAEEFKESMVVIKFSIMRNIKVIVIRIVLELFEFASIVIRRNKHSSHTLLLKKK